jgi:hypothetical protein
MSTIDRVALFVLGCCYLVVAAIELSSLGCANC